MKSHVDAGGKLKDLVEENAKTAAIEVATMLASTSGGSPLPDGLVMRDSPGKSIGMFATRAYQRGERRTLTFSFASWAVEAILTVASQMGKVSRIRDADGCSVEGSSRSRGRKGSFERSRHSDSK